MRWKIFVILGIGAFGFALYAANKAIWIGISQGSLASQFIFSLAAFAFVVVGVLHFYMAFGLRYGRLDAVVGSKNSATFIKNGKKIRSQIQIQFARNLDADDLSQMKKEQIVFFISGWRPWSCSAALFLPSYT